MAKAMPVFAEDRQHRRRVELAHPCETPVRRLGEARAGIGFLLLKNALFWGSIALMCALFYSLI
jgi:hypothetical protein